MTRIHGWRCFSCEAVFKLLAEETNRGREAQSLLFSPTGQSFVCPCCERHGTLQPAFNVITNPDHCLLPHEAWQAFNGMGLPKEQSPSEEEVRRLLIEVGVEAVNTSSTVGGRCQVKNVRCKDGTTMHFTISGYGVCVHKLTRKETEDASSEFHKTKEGQQEEKASRHQRGHQDGDGELG